MYPNTENTQRIDMKQIGIPHNTEMSPSCWDLVEQYFYDDVGLIHIDTEGVIEHLLKGTENTNDTTKQYQTY